jgi:hypothetical protein
MRFSCRAVENLMLSDDVLARADVNWGGMQERIRNWVIANPEHQFHSDTQAFVDGGFDRKGHNLKAIRNILVGLMSSKPWEVLVGQTLAELAKNGGPPSDGNLREFLGEAAAQQLLGLPAP